MKNINIFLPAILVFLILSCSKHGSINGNNSDNPIPVLLSVSPNNIPAGSGTLTLTVTGSNFVNGSLVQWNGISLNTGFVNAAQVTAVLPSANITNAGTASIKVFTPLPGGGTSGTITFTITSSSTSPVINSLSPANAIVNGGGFTLTVSGSGFNNASVINWNGTGLSTNYINASQLSAFVPAADITTAGTASVTVSSPLPAGQSNAVLFAINSASAVKRFLFDATHAETAGNADWVIDEDNSFPQRIPTPAQSTITASTDESYWTGGISSWGIGLAKLNQTVETLSAGSAITYGNSSNSQDLSNYDVFIVDEPNNVFTSAEKMAILNFVNNGGGLLMVSDHYMSDRDGDGWDSPGIWNDLMSNNAVQNNPFGFSIDLLNFSEVSANVSSTVNTILNGSQGTVTQIQFNNGTSATINPAVNPNVTGLIWRSSDSHNNNNIMSLSSIYGTGRVFFIGDSSPTDDGTGDPSNVLYGGWLNYSHKQLFMNASLWLAKLQ